MRPPSKGFTRELQVGLFGLVAFIVIFAFSFRFTDSPIFRRGTELVTYIDDATGLFLNSKVKLAGIDVGAVKKIELENGRAKITMIVNKGVVVPKEAHVEPKPLGILGDKYLEIVLPKNGDSVPASEAPGAWYQRFKEFFIASAHAQEVPLTPTGVDTATTPAFKSGDKIKSVNSATTLDDLARQMGGISTDVKQLTKKLNLMLDENRPDIRTLIQSLNRTSNQLEQVFKQIDSKKLGQNLDALSAASGNVAKSMEKVDIIISRVEKGEGTVGKLLADPAIALELQRSLETLNAALERVTRTILVVDLSTEYYAPAKTSKTYVTLAIRPKEDTAYVAQVVIDPRGTFSRTITCSSTDGAPQTCVDTTVNDREAVSFSLMYEKRIWNLAARIGLMENRGGLGLDWYLWHDRIRLGADIFNLTRDGNNPHVKAYVKWSFLEYLYVTVGGDELASKIRSGVGRPSFMIGGGIRFTDDDVKSVLLIPGIP